MNNNMHTPWHMGYPEWLELSFFALLSLIVLVFLIQCIPRKPITKSISLPRGRFSGFQDAPEAQLIMLALPLELLWEIAQFPLYTVWHEGDWSYILYGLAHCTLGDLLILLIVYWIVALLNRDRYWCHSSILLNGLLFTVLGVVYTIFSETVNVRVKGTWDYTELMPIVPIINVGGMPFLQWLLIPPVLLWLLKTIITARTSRDAT